MRKRHFSWFWKKLASWSTRPILKLFRRGLFGEQRFRPTFLVSPVNWKAPRKRGLRFSMDWSRVVSPDKYLLPSFRGPNPRPRSEPARDRLIKILPWPPPSWTGPIWVSPRSRCTASRRFCTTEKDVGNEPEQRRSSFSRAFFLTPIAPWRRRFSAVAKDRCHCRRIFSQEWRFVWPRVDLEFVNWDFPKIATIVLNIYCLVMCYLSMMLYIQFVEFSMKCNYIQAYQILIFCIG